MPEISPRHESGLERLNRAVTAYLEQSAPTTTHELGSVGEAGSAGKTTTLVTFAALLAQLGFEVEIVDLDGQGNASKHLGIGSSPYEEDRLVEPGGAYPVPLMLGDALLRRKAKFPGEDAPREITLDDIRRCAYNEHGIPGYGVINDDPDTIAWLKRIHVYPNGPSYVTGEKIDFYQDEAELSKDPFAGMVLSRLMNKVTTRPHFRLYDLHGTKSLSMMSALVRMKRVFNCVQLDDKTTGPDLDHLKTTIEEVREYNPDLQLAMILPCRVKAERQRGNHGREMLKRLHARHGSLVADVEIREAVTVNEAYTNREPLPLWVPKDPVTDDYRRALAWAFEHGVFS
ncbi:ParA family protein [Amycolatopsis sp. ATCC 39116]|uniref:ParA family protein n=1 Tax=Amycolatopsis sp. (strain ATCC 39116 / 75iv2) TaxID=385957 RepID=UPI000A03A10D|nr:ParA family protein [Amycolatopsis sp. ATCC 39116]